MFFRINSAFQVASQEEVTWIKFQEVWRPIYAKACHAGITNNSEPNTKRTKETQTHYCV